MKARVTSNPYKLGNGWFDVGQVVEIERETAHYYVLVKSSYRINKEKMALTGWAGRYAHTIEFEIIEEAPAAVVEPVAMNTEILIATAGDEGDISDRVEVVAVALGSLGPVSKRVDPISENVARVYAKLPVGVAVREALDLLYPLEFVLTAYPLGAQDMIPDNPAPAVAGRPGDLPAAWSYQYGLSGEDYRHGRDGWRQEVEDGNTQRGYWDWVEAQIEETEDAADLEVRQVLAAGGVVVLVDRARVDAESLAELAGWLNNGDRDADLAVFPGDVTQVLGPVADPDAAELVREIEEYLNDQEEDNPRAVVCVGSVWNARPVPALDLAGVINRVAACYSGISLELGENRPDANALVITWDHSPGEKEEREIRAALLAALNEMADALPACCLSLSVPNEWHGRPVDREGLAAWCGRQGGGDFSLALNALPGAKLAIHWVTGPRPVPGLEAGILADARTWLHEGGTLDPDEPAAVEPCRMLMAIPRDWNGRAINFDTVGEWCAERSNGFTLELSPTVCEPGGVVVSWASGADPVSVRPGLGRQLEARAVDFLNALYPAEPADPAEIALEPARILLAVPRRWNGSTVDRDALGVWLQDMGGQWPAGVSVVLDAKPSSESGEIFAQWLTANPNHPTFRADMIDDVKEWLDDMAPGL